MTIQPHLAGLVLAVVLARSAAADPTVDTRADAHIDAGWSAYHAKRYGDAIREFQAANGLRADPKLLYSIAQAQRVSGDCASAILSYESFIATESTATLGSAEDVELRKLSADNIERCRQQLARPAPPPEVVTRIVQVPAQTVEPRREVITRPWYRDRMGHTLVIGGAIAATVGGLAWRSGRNSILLANTAADHASNLDRRAAASSGYTYQQLGVAAAIIGGGLVLGGVVRYGSASRREVRFTASPTRGGGAVSLELGL